MTKINYLKKMSIASIGAIPKDFKKLAHNTRVPMLHVFGRVESTESGTSQFGPWIAFVGSFKAIKLDDGEVFRAAKCLLPGLASDAISEAVDCANGGIVEFALEVGMRRIVKLDARGEETGAGYEYTLTPLIGIDEAADPLAALEARVQKSLPAPAPDLVDQAGEPEHEVKPAKSKK